MSQWDSELVSDILILASSEHYNDYNYYNGYNVYNDYNDFLKNEQFTTEVCVFETSFRDPLCWTDIEEVIQAQSNQPRYKLKLLITVSRDSPQQLLRNCVKCKKERGIIMYTGHISRC